jgi:hypothetical protein
MYYIIEEADVDTLGDGYETVDEVKAFCKANIGRHVVLKLAGRAKTERIEKVLSSFDSVVKRTKLPKGAQPAPKKKEVKE